MVTTQVRWMHRGMVVGMVVGLLVGVGCAGPITQAKQVPAHTAVWAPALAHDFQRWLGQDVGWTQKQRLAHIEHEWLAPLSRLPLSDRQRIANAIQDQIRSQRLVTERQRVLRTLLGGDDDASATFLTLR